MRAMIWAATIAAGVTSAADAGAQERNPAAVHIARMKAAESACRLNLDHERIDAFIAEHGLAQAVEVELRRYRSIFSVGVEPSYCPMFEQSARAYGFAREG